MIRNFILLLASLFFIPNTLLGKDISLDDIPVQDAGRIKPMHTIAENHLLLIYERRSIRDYERNSFLF